MSYSDIGKQAKDFLGKKSGLSQAKSFTMKAKTSSGVSLKSTTKLGKSAKLNAKFKQSGINFSKIDIVSDGSVVIEADTPASFVDGLVLNTSYTMGTEKWCSGKGNAESAQVGFEFTQDQFVFNHSMDFLGKNGDNDALTMDSDLGFTMDNFSFGASVSSFMPSVFGGDGGASGMDSYAVKCGYKTGDFELSATVGEPGKSNNLSAGFFHNVSSSTSWGFVFKQGKGDSIKNRDFNLTVGAEFVNDPTQTVKFAVGQDGVGQFKVAQKMDNGATLSLQTKINFNNIESDAKFGVGYEMSL